MKAPEKIYVLNHKDYSDRRILNAFTEREDNNDIEYTRTDAFIEKAAEWLKNNASNYAFVDTDRIGNVADIDLSLISDFKNYMKGE